MFLTIPAVASVSSSGNYKIDTSLSESQKVQAVSPTYNTVQVVSEPVIVLPTSDTYKITKITVTQAPFTAKFTLVDAMTALRSITGLTVLSAGDMIRYDVAPLANGVSFPDNKVDLEDVVVILDRITSSPFL